MNIVRRVDEIVQEYQGEIATRAPVLKSKSVGSERKGINGKQKDIIHKSR